MRAKLLPGILLVTLLGAGLALSGAPAGSQQQDFYIVSVTKTVEGDGPTGPYAVNVTCTNPFSAPAGPFDFTVQDGETVPLSVNFNDECTVTETDELGADAVAYECTEDVDATCVDDQTVAIDVNDSGGEGNIEITNTFDPEVIDEEVDPPAEDVVVASPTFTG